MLIRSRPLSVALILVVVATTIAIHLVPGLDASLLENEIRNSLHFILFALVAAAVYTLVPTGPVGKFLIAPIVALSIGVLAEFAQQFAGGVVDMTDVARDLSGAATMLVALLFFSASGRAERGSFKQLALGLLASVIAAVVVLPLAYWGSALLVERDRHPVVLDFDSRFSTYRYFALNSELTLVRDSAADAKTRAELLLSKRGRSGLGIQTAHYDWSKETTLVFSAEVVEGNTKQLSIHINDKRNRGKFADTAAGSVTLLDGKREYRISIQSMVAEAGRGDELTNIRQLVFLARDKQAGARLRLSDIRLE